ncbi:MAG: hypothetical protein BGO87_12925 [Flavobacteriia bacterium 40-80]|nr:MAG: hypothetical protein BGO87_12925 [Flavobacteriia bacterium 40-80]
MKINFKSLLAFILLSGLYSCSTSEERSIIPAEKIAFKSHSDSIPKNHGKLFEINCEYPQKLPHTIYKPDSELLTIHNAESYIEKLKYHVTPALEKFILDNKSWNAKREGWFHEPWIGNTREPILGCYSGNDNKKGTFSNVNEDQLGYVLVLYDSLAALTLGEIFGTDGMVPLTKSGKIDLEKEKGQFREGSVILKLAFSSLNSDKWSDMEGAPEFQIYNNNTFDKTYKYHTVSLFQIDLIVKDSKNAPATGWMFSTLVYDKSIKSKNILDKFIPLGGMWGNDPEVNTDISQVYYEQNPLLKETWINNSAPYYSRETLGWGGRLSGPNDGAIALDGIVDGKKYERLQMTSCMSCHLPAQQKFKSFLLPAKDISKNIFYSNNDLNWKRYFRNLKGTESFDEGEYSFDYDMAIAFKSMSAYLNYLNTLQKKPSYNITDQKDNYQLFEDYRKVKNNPK